MDSIIISVEVHLQGGMKDKKKHKQTESTHYGLFFCFLFLLWVNAISEGTCCKRKKKERNSIKENDATNTSCVYIMRHTATQQS